MAINFDKYNDAVRQWGASGKNLMKSTGTAMGIKGRSLSRIRDRYGVDSTGVINKVTFTTISRSLIFISAGAGKGMGGSKGSRWIDRYGQRKSTNPSSLGKAGSGSRPERPFIEKALSSPDGLEALADLVAVHQADAIIENVYKK
ncbi:MAG: hypothetical protein ACTHMC_05245 [Pseudobacter sp.]|uniref:hypothetical protein n=1 Tax=Pseudobacter sp. TaxID=2045420 RepID=UPI003F7DF9D9